MSKKKRVTGLVVWICIVVALLVCGLLIGGPAVKHESIKEVMRDAVMTYLKKKCWSLHMEQRKNMVWIL